MIPKELEIEGKMASKISFKLVMNCITVILLIYGIFEMKSFLNENFVENDTELKRKVDRAFRSQKLKNTKEKIKDTNSAPTDNRDSEVIINIEGTK